jgi:uncharacterized membrane protein YeaQ/YmgE (transglycosylase-associated protein family)
MSIVSWILLGAVVGLMGARLRPGRLPGGALGAAITGAAGGFVGGGVFAALDDRSVSGLDLVTAVTAIVGAVLMLTAIHKADYAEPRPD